MHVSLRQLALVTDAAGQSGFVVVLCATAAGIGAICAAIRWLLRADRPPRPSGELRRQQQLTAQAVITDPPRLPVTVTSGAVAGVLVALAVIGLLEADQLLVTVLATALAGAASGLGGVSGRVAWRLYRAPARKCGRRRRRKLRPLRPRRWFWGFGLAGALVGLIGARSGWQAPAWLIPGGLAVLGVAALSLWVELRQDKAQALAVAESVSTRTWLRVTIQVGLLSAVNLSSTVYLWSAINRPLKEIFGTGVATWVVVVSTGGLLVTLVIVAMRRTWSACNLAYVCSWGSAGALVLAAVGTDSAPLLLVASFLAGLFGVSSVALVPYVICWAAQVRRDVERTQSINTNVWGTFVGVLLVIATVLSAQALLGLRTTFVLNILVVIASTPLLRWLPVDVRERDLRTRREIVASMPEQLRANPRLLFGMILAGVAGTQLQLLYGTYGVILSDSKIDGFEPLVTGAFLLAMACMALTGRLFTGINALWLGAAMLAAAFPIGLLSWWFGHPIDGWFMVGIAFQVEWGSTILSDKLALLTVDPGANRDLQNGMVNQAKYGMAMALVALAPGLITALGQVGVYWLGTGVGLLAPLCVFCLWLLKRRPAA